MDVLPGLCYLSRDGTAVDILKALDTWSNYTVKILVTLAQCSRRPIGMCMYGWLVGLLICSYKPKMNILQLQGLVLNCKFFTALESGLRCCI